MTSFVTYYEFIKLGISAKNIHFWGKTLNITKSLKLSLTAILVFCFFLCFFLPMSYAQPKIGEKAPGFITSTLDGKRMALKDYWEQKGSKAIVLSFFATWCEPCKEDLKYLQKVQNEYTGQGIQILAVLTQDSSKEEVTRKFLQGLGVQLPVLLDENGIIGKRYAITGLPCNFLVDQGGTLKAKYLGYSEAVRQDFEKRLKEILAAK